MHTPIQITFRDVQHSDAIEQYVRTRAEKLDGLASRIVSCHVALELPHRHSQRGRHYRVRIDVHVPGGDVVVGNTHEDDRNEEDLYAAIDAAFDQAGRQLQDLVRRQRGSTKSHEPS
jgi:ribosomal subunit interface protein